MSDYVTIDMSNSKVPVDTLLYRVAARLGIIDPESDTYSGANSPADKMIQQFARRTFPKYPFA
jgi:endonuclease III